MKCDMLGVPLRCFLPGNVITTLAGTKRDKGKDLFLDVGLDPGVILFSAQLASAAAWELWI